MHDPAPVPLGPFSPLIPVYSRDAGLLSVPQTYYAASTTGPLNMSFPKLECFPQLLSTIPLLLKPTKVLSLCISVIVRSPLSHLIAPYTVCVIIRLKTTFPTQL